MVFIKLILINIIFNCAIKGLLRKTKIKRGIIKGMIFHLDLWTQYTSNEYEK